MKCVFLEKSSSYFRHNLQIILVISGPYSKPWKAQLSVTKADVILGERGIEG